jgi:DNA (cytosine-5)-methyltransferase 1
VKGLVSTHQGDAIKRIIADFEKAGYSTTYKVLNASHFGVPQKRERVFIIGIRKDVKGSFEFPEAPWDIVPIGRVLEGHREVDPKYHFSDRALRGLAKANKAFNKGRAQPLNAPCNTISTHLSKVSLNGTDPVLLTAPGKYRRLTPKEAARIQSFPEGFEFSGPDGKKYIQIGNAIPPVLMWHIANSLKSQVFDGRPILKKGAERNNVENPVPENLFREKGVFVPA